MIDSTKALVIFLLFISCTEKENNSCSIDNEFKNEFFNCLSIVESTMQREGTDTVNLFITTSDVMQAIKCLESITKQRNHMKFEEVGFAVYETEEELDGDIKIWTDWYEKNKCSYTMDSAEVAFRVVKVKFPDYKSASVIDSLGKIWMEYKGDSIKIKDSLFHVSMGTYWPTVKVSP